MSQKLRALIVKPEDLSSLEPTWWKVRTNYGFTRIFVCMHIHTEKWLIKNILKCYKVDYILVELVESNELSVFFNWGGKDTGACENKDIVPTS